MNPLSANTVSVILSSAGLKAVRRNHPWLYSKGIEKINRQGNSGDIAVLYDNKRKFAGIGLLDIHSPIMVRVLHSGKPITLSKEWLSEKISESIVRRASLINDSSTTGYRLVNGENDQLAGIVADIYENTLVIKLDSTCWLPHLDKLTNIFISLVHPERIVLRMSRSVKEFSEIADGTVIFGTKINQPITFTENNIQFYTDPAEGQKTGFFLDQRNNRLIAGKLSKGLNVLNVFAYTGGFSLYAAAGGAKSVASLDISKPALEACGDNFRLNGFRTPHRLICGDAFEEMEKLRKNGEKFGMVIVDPPSFARKQSDVNGAFKAYEKVNRIAVNLIEKGGILAAASCSARVSAEEFFNIVLKVCRASGRKFSELERTGHAIDHTAGFDEGSYLKCIFVRFD
ncbi:putative RNA methylase [Denitrovibrio acetiphilus DSM 12809]|uniref:Putative RNA methylase n=1 Tax=Denitrovibrio acetiphilus (strain DSM 12809 / NBRC 114555 / N2460) TaxID=522772 RepID=D4H6U3_DENA2|nr:class I SAM-dependent rRNA methyltransferase [Denitrovibrio acetiphilus]ADD67809.1 putative RNA methylase [Denitrovibrio acetiphilus DSM 12809]